MDDRLFCQREINHEGSHSAQYRVADEVDRGTATVEWAPDDVWHRLSLQIDKRKR